MSNKLHSAIVRGVLAAFIPQPRPPQSPILSRFVPVW